MSVLAIIPARSGSKSIPDKNVLSFRGRPLLVHSVEQALAARNVDRVIVSTDSPRYREIALKAGAEAPFLRPGEIAGDLATDLETFRHALDWLAEKEGYRPAVCVHLRPTYPTRTAADIEAAVDLLLQDPAADSVRSVTLAPHTPYKMWRLEANGLLASLLSSDIPEAYNQPRQALPPVYLQNAAVDVVRASVILGGSMTGARIRAYVMADFHDIDDWSDWSNAETNRGSDPVPSGLTFAFDLDGVIATLTTDNDYGRSRPYAPAIDVVNRLHAAGNRIVIYTARGSLTGRDWTGVTRDQLAAWGVRHDELHFGKPAADYYVDDRMISLAALQSWIRSRGNDTTRESA